MNLSTALIGLVVLAVFAAIVVNEVKKRKNGGGGCSCGCGGCSNAAACGQAAKEPSPDTQR